MNDKKFSFKGKGDAVDPDGWKSLNRICLDSVDDPADYHTEDPGLVAAVDTAMSLGMPLLLTGAPGAGKTQLAYRIAYELGCGKPIFFPVKSGSEAQDLFYSVDHLRRLHAAQIEKTKQVPNDSEAKTDLDPQDPVDIRRFIRFQGLGLAILRALPQDQLRDLDLWDHAWPEDKRQNADGHERQPSVVLIDEIDKAPTDFCNDMLEEIRKLEFSLPELDSRPISLYAGSALLTDKEKMCLRPQIVITSNSEKGGLPEPFLRRCIYYHIETPKQKVLETIINKRLAKAAGLDREFQNRCLDFFVALRDNQNLEKKPSTSELLAWFLTMAESKVVWKVDDISSEAWCYIASHCLLKTQQDQAQSEPLMQGWQQHR